MLFNPTSTFIFTCVSISTQTHTLVTHTYIYISYTHTHIYIYICVCVCIDIRCRYVAIETATMFWIEDTKYGEWCSLQIHIIGWWLLVSSYIVYFLLTMLKWSCFQKWCLFLRCFKEWELREPCIMYYHVLSCHVAVDPTRSQSGFVCFTSAGRKKGRRLWLRKIWHLHVARL